MNAVIVELNMMVQELIVKTAQSVREDQTIPVTVGLVIVYICRIRISENVVCVRRYQKVKDMSIIHYIAKYVGKIVWIIIVLSVYLQSDSEDIFPRK